MDLSPGPQNAARRRTFESLGWTVVSQPEP
jgi:hypothetical protein